MFLSESALSGPQFFYLAPLVIFLPAAGLLVNILFGKWFSEKVIGIVASLAVGLAFIVSLLLGVSLNSSPGTHIVPLFNWISIGELKVNWALQVDTLAVVMMLVVSGVGCLIHVYAIGYMHDDVRHNGDPQRFRRFFVYLNLFIAMMMVLVSSDNYLMLFVGWEGVGLCSYLLIGFWFDKGEGSIGNALAAKKAFIVNRVGDFGFIIAALTMFWVFHSFNFEIVFERAPQVALVIPAAIVAITLFMLLGVTGKSAQIPLYVWLPDAMAGPTPVSALIHAATMVTAGVYLITRSAPLFNLAPQVQFWVALVGGVTALFAATIAVAQFDIKKVLAYSTISQLGFMVAAVGMGAYVAGMFHLVAHAFFKALLFLAAGSVIQGVERGEHDAEHNAKQKKPVKSGGHFDPQDMRNMGGLRTRMRVTFWVYLIGALALAGIPPLAGFWSKDEILAEATRLDPLVFWLLIIAAFFTAFYMGRQVFLVFFGKPRSAPAEHASESAPVMTVPLIVLAVLTVVGGAMNLPRLGTFAKWLEHTLGEFVQEGEFVLTVALLASAGSLVAIFLAWLVYYRRYQALQEQPSARRPDDPLRPLLGPVFTVLENKYYVDEAYRAVIIKPYIWLSAFLAEKVDWGFLHDGIDTFFAAGYRRFSELLSLRIDLGVIDWIANTIGRLAQRLAANFRRLETGYVRNYALAVFFGVVIIIGYLILR